MTELTWKQSHNHANYNHNMGTFEIDAADMTSFLRTSGLTFL